MQLWEDTYTHSTVRTNDGTHSFFLVPVPVQVPVQVPRRPWSPRPWLPPSLNTDPHLFRPCLLFFRLAQWFLLFLPPYPPFPSHTPAHFFSTSTTTDLSDYSFSLLLPYPSPNLVFVTIGFSSSSPLSLFGHVLLSSLALAVVVSVSHNDAPSGPPPSDQPVSCISGSSDLTCPTAVSGFGPPVPR